MDYYVPGTRIERPEVGPVDGNAFAVLAAVRKALRRAGVPDSVIEAYAREAKSGDYDHLVETSARYVDFV